MIKNVSFDENRANVFILVFEITLKKLNIWVIDKIGKNITEVIL